MPDFRYKAKDIEARYTTGTVDALTREDAVAKLIERGLFVTSITEKAEKKARFTLSAKDLANFCKELAIMLKSGLPLVKCLQIIAGNETSRLRQKKVCQDLHRAIRGGATLSEAMRDQGRVFPELIINMFYSGEISGTIGDVSEKMSEYYMSEYKLKKKISQATAYPKLLAVMTLGVVVILFAFVMPSMMAVLEGQQMELPPITQFMMAISDIIVYRWFNLIIAGALIFAIVIYVKEVKLIRYYWDMLLLRVAVFGPLMRIIYTARFARTLSSLYGSGIQLITAIGVSSKIIGNLYVEGQFPDILTKIKQGELLSAAIASVEGFNEKLMSMIIIGEETGKLDEILTHTSASFEYDADVAIESLLAMLLPILLIIMAVIIASVIISVMLPIYQMYETIGGM